MVGLSLPLTFFQHTAFLVVTHYEIALIFSGHDTILPYIELLFFESDSFYQFVECARKLRDNDLD